MTISFFYPQKYGVVTIMCLEIFVLNHV